MIKRTSRALAADGRSPLWDGHVSERDRWLRRAYGLKLEWWQTILIVQGGRCPGCDRLFKPRRPPCVDHDHDTREIRGLLCHSCNRGLKRNLVRYLLDPPARQVGPFYVPRGRGPRRRLGSPYQGHPLTPAELVALVDRLSADYRGAEVTDDGDPGG